ncbi:MFS general substrate transporter [Cucurbitaria berberidis CBS 394.84]|uniref:MFS general substrate transporter n=1 Tax=Cucurbitaria berberidis CBS 394.84 TaxID=1168544 RepID=A0A9P4LE96_9PLEO|nr:MFS general substrate transporter [Cucurbitaria berberidis CBS 394.84]KAF1850894.1 MFS general substrate transporter [Cucurbitaria berberidis CBS 394.84]
MSVQNPSPLSAQGAILQRTSSNGDAINLEAKVSDPEGDQPRLQPSTDQSEIQVESEELQGSRLVLVTISFMLSILLVALDQNIISTAIPKITAQFQTTNDIGWWGAAYLLAQMAFQPPFGRVYIYFDMKRTYQVSLLIFTVGSIICAVSKSSAVFTFGRAFAGVGAAGINSGAFAIGTRIVPMKNRPLYLSIVSSMYGVSAVAGPLLGGVFADSKALTWRFCFWINLPICGLALASITFFLRTRFQSNTNIALTQKLLRLDIQGSTILIGASVCLIIALQMGGVTRPWSDSRAWGCLLGCGLLTIAFIIWEWRSGETATFPGHVALQRSMGLSAVFLCLFFMVTFVHSYYLPLFFQVVQGTTAERSGIQLLPYLVPEVVAAIVSGAFITKTGHYVPLMWLGSSLVTVGSGMLYTLQPGSPQREWVGYQVLTSIGFGMTIQVPYTVVQVVLEQGDVPMGNALLMFCMCLGGSVAVGIGQNIFSSVLIRELRRSAEFRDIADVVRHIGGTELRGRFPKSLVDRLIIVYSRAITATFLLPIAAGGLAFLVSIGIERRKLNIKKSI